MGIRVKNQEHAVINLRYNGTLTVTTNRDCAMVPFSGSIANVCATVSAAGTGAQATVVDVHYLGTTIFADLTKITLAATTGEATYSAVSTVSVTAGAMLVLDVDTISTAAKNLDVLIVISRTGGKNETNLTDLDLVL